MHAPVVNNGWPVGRAALSDEAEWCCEQLRQVAGPAAPGK